MSQVYLFMSDFLNLNLNTVHIITLETIECVDENEIYIIVSCEVLQPIMQE